MCAAGWALKQLGALHDRSGVATEPVLQEQPTAELWMDGRDRPSARATFSQHQPARELRQGGAVGRGARHLDRGPQVRHHLAAADAVHGLGVYLLDDGHGGGAAAGCRMMQ